MIGEIAEVAATQEIPLTPAQIVTIAEAALKDPKLNQTSRWPSPPSSSTSRTEPNCDQPDTAHNSGQRSPARSNAARQRVLTNLHDLSDAELLSILLWGGTRQAEIEAAYNLLTHVGGDLLMLRRFSTQELQDWNLDVRTIARLHALIEMETRLAVPTFHDADKITDPNQAAKMMMIRLRARAGGDSHDAAQRRAPHPGHRHGRHRPTQHGHPAGSWADIFAPAVRYHATAIIVFHNHPQGRQIPRLPTSV